MEFFFSRMAATFLISLVLGISAALASPPEKGICPVHHIRMESITLRMVYGMPSQLEFEEMRVEKTRFPHGRDYVLAGCVVKPAKSVAGFLCPECVKARKEWLAPREK